MFETSVSFVNNLRQEAHGNVVHNYGPGNGKDNYLLNPNIGVFLFFLFCLVFLPIKAI